MFIQTASGTLDKVHASKDNKEKGTMALVKADRSVDFDGNLKQIKGRGNSTWGFAKKPYNIKLENSSDLLGMGKGKGWCLLANYADRSLLRNRIVYNLAEETGIPFTMDSRNIDLYINGDYMGSYLIMLTLVFPISILSYHRKNRNRKNESQHYGSGRCHK